MLEEELIIQEPSPSELALIASAMNLFMIRDETTVTVTQLIKAAGVSRSLFYRYFASKEDVFAAILLRDEIAFNTKMMDFKSIESTGELISEALRFRIQQIDRYRVLLRLESHLVSSASDLPRFKQWQSLRKAHIEAFSELITQLKLSGKSVRSQEQARYHYGMIWSLANGVAQLSETDFFHELIHDRRGFNRFLLDTLKTVGDHHD